MSLLARFFWVKLIWISKNVSFSLYCVIQRQLRNTSFLWEVAINMQLCRLFSCSGFIIHTIFFSVVPGQWSESYDRVWSRDISMEKGVFWHVKTWTSNADSRRPSTSNSGYHHWTATKAAWRSRLWRLCEWNGRNFSVSNLLALRLGNWRNRLDLVWIARRWTGFKWAYDQKNCTKSGNEIPVTQACTNQDE